MKLGDRSYVKSKSSFNTKTEVVAHIRRIFGEISKMHREGIMRMGSNEILEIVGDYAIKFKDKKFSFYIGKF